MSLIEFRKWANKNEFEKNPLFEIRKELDCRIVDIAEKLQISTCLVCAIENGDRHKYINDRSMPKTPKGKAMLKKMMETFNKPLDHFVDGV